MPSLALIAAVRLRESVKGRFNSVEQAIADHVLAADPTADKRFSAWISAHLSTGSLKFEQLGPLKQALSIHTGSESERQQAFVIHDHNPDEVLRQHLHGRAKRRSHPALDLSPAVETILLGERLRIYAASSRDGIRDLLGDGPWAEVAWESKATIYCFTGSVLALDEPVMGIEKLGLFTYNGARVATLAPAERGLIYNDLLSEPSQRNLVLRIDGNALSWLRPEERTRDLCEAALSSDLGALEHVPVEHDITPRVEAMLFEAPHRIGELSPPLLKDVRLQMAAVRGFGPSVGLIPAHLRAAGVEEEAVRSDAAAIQHIDAHRQTPWMASRVLDEAPALLPHLNPALVSERQLLESIRQDLLSHTSVPPECQTLGVAAAIAKAVPMMVGTIAPQYRFEQVIELAVGQHYPAIQEIDAEKWTPRIIAAAALDAKRALELMTPDAKVDDDLAMLLAYLVPESIGKLTISHLPPDTQADIHEIAVSRDPKVISMIPEDCHTDRLLDIHHGHAVTPPVRHPNDLAPPPVPGRHVGGAPAPG